MFSVEIRVVAFLQMQGTDCYGYQNAPAYANFFMGQLLMSAVNLRPCSWLRFIDDIEIKGCTAARPWRLFSTTSTISTKVYKVHSWNFKRVSGHQIKACGRHNTCWFLYKSNRYPPVSLTHKLQSETLLQKCSLQSCRICSYSIKSKRADWPPLQTGLWETDNVTYYWESTTT